MRQGQLCDPDDVAEDVRLGPLWEESQGGWCRMAYLPEEWGVLCECRVLHPRGRCTRDTPLSLAAHDHVRL